MDLLNHKDSFLEIPHSADLALQVWAASLSGLFIQAARGMVSLLRIDNSEGSEVYRKIELQEIDLENLLVSFLNELLNDLQQNKKVYDQFRLEISHSELTGNLTGKTICGVGREIKAVTYHDLRIVKTKIGYQTTIVFDI